ncbi:unnamed protein product [marine sediment metagenome]|uniref:Uncharacterized protein n=1 Tax=marine sediment metagenome TaxID=412755 RepID=X1JU69_9ZZZZ
MIVSFPEAREEMEEYEPHIKDGIVVYAGVDYGAILKEAEKEADIIFHFFSLASIRALYFV